jgi:hypothetical protein
MREIIAHALLRPVSSADRGTQLEIAKVLKKAGYESERRTLAGRTERCYVKKVVKK